VQIGDGVYALLNTTAVFGKAVKVRSANDWIASVTKDVSPVFV
jgi:hypothetical protein